MSKTNPTRRLVIFEETRNPQNPVGIHYEPINKLGLPICGDAPELPSILELPLRTLIFFTDLFNLPKYKGWAVVGAGPYRDISYEGKFYAVILEQTQPPQVQPQVQGYPQQLHGYGHLHAGSKNEAMKESPPEKS
ncbi:hypothetical protein N7478_005194 [Penicillium angulare]|uniref:uncharacterized protein n=1 Tax=Penicillium angulare TaxID=116970 RepID=UPI0025421B57|nr:uncharacterized protein N7478_005194 [Penicillium angulare]KAJ5279822.1 hypothetical protein N7478_005194 [Penicillium angulare]